MTEAGQRSQQYSNGLMVDSSKSSSFYQVTSIVMAASQCHRPTLASVAGPARCVRIGGEARSRERSGDNHWSERRRAHASRPQPSFRRAEQLYSCERFSRPWPKAVQRELRLLPRLDVDED